MDENKLQNNNGKELYRKLSNALKFAGITEVQYRMFMENRYPGLEKERLDTLVDILFHTFK